MIMPPDKAESFDAEISRGTEGLHTVVASLTKIDVQRAKASVPEDETKVLGLIKAGTGFDAVNASVRSSMQTWCRSITVPSLRHHYSAICAVIDFYS